MGRGAGVFHALCAPSTEETLWPQCTGSGSGGHGWCWEEGVDVSIRNRMNEVDGFVQKRRPKPGKAGVRVVRGLVLGVLADIWGCGSGHGGS